MNRFVMVKSQTAIDGKPLDVGRNRRRKGAENEDKILLEIIKRQKSGEDCTPTLLIKALGITKTSVHKHLNVLRDAVIIFKDGNHYRADLTRDTDHDKALDLLKRKAHLRLWFFEEAQPMDKASKQKLSDGTVIPAIKNEICTCLVILEESYRLKQEEINLTKEGKISNAFYDELAVDISEFIGRRLTEALNLKREAWESLTQKGEPFWHLIVDSLLEHHSHEEYFNEEEGAKIDVLFREWQKKEKFRRE